MNQAAAPKISLVIPAFNEERLLPRLLDTVDRAREAYARGREAVEVILADNQSTDSTAAIAEGRGCRVVPVTYAVLVPIVVLIKIDTGVVFCRRRDFEAIGGYDETMKFAEDIRFLWVLRRLGKTRGQSLIRLREAKAIASTRKFDRWGEWHYLTFPFRLAWSRLRADQGFDAVAEKYWYSGER